MCFAVDYRLKDAAGAYPDTVKWWPALTEPHGSWMPPLQNMYPAVRDIKAALRWIHANAAAYNADASSLTLQGGSAGATAAIELALTGGVDQPFAQDYTGELGADDASVWCAARSTRLDGSTLRVQLALAGDVSREILKKVHSVTFDKTPERGPGFPRVLATV